jgi:type IV pilus assembly protein PilV
MSLVRTKKAGAASAGFTLIEVLVALVILSVGLLGVCALILNAVKSNDSSYMQSQAALLANGMCDSMRANAQGAISGDYNTGGYISTYTTSSNCGGTTTSSSSGGSSGGSGTCTAAQVAQTDLNNWVNRLPQLLPSGAGSVTVTSATVDGGNLATVSVEWNDTRAAIAFSGSSSSSGGSSSGGSSGTTLGSVGVKCNLP